MGARAALASGEPDGVLAQSASTRVLAVVGDCCGDEEAAT